jgi:hypothetical protein
MTESEWLRSDDVGLMVRWFRQEWRGDEADLDRLLQRYFLECCRRIGRNLPQVRTRAAVEVAQRFLDGLAPQEELGTADWLAEAAAFSFDHVPETENSAAIVQWCDDFTRAKSWCGSGTTERFFVIRAGVLSAATSSSSHAITVSV